MFRPQLWPTGEQYKGNPFNKAAARTQDVKEVWFAGGHSDVGGGYSEKESAVAKIPLAWMIEEMEPMGLKFRRQTVKDIVLGANPKKPQYVKPHALSATHDTRSWGWALLEIIPRIGPKGVSLPLYERRPMAENALVHQSVFEREAGGLGLSPNVPKNAVKVPAGPLSAPG
jgi:hypothetical protein